MTEKAGAIHIPIRARIGRVLHNLAEDGKVGRAIQLGRERVPQYISKEELAASYSARPNKQEREPATSGLEFWQPQYVGGMIVPIIKEEVQEPTDTTS